MKPVSKAGQGRRFFISIGITTGLVESASRITDSVQTMRHVFLRTFGYEDVPGFGIDPGVQHAREALRNFAKGRSPNDTVVLYHTGHADIVDGEHRIWMGGTKDPHSQTLRTPEFASLLLSRTPLRRLMLVLDVCFAAEGGAQSLLAGLHSGRQEDKTLALITSAHPREQVRAGDFALLFQAAVDHPSTVGHEPVYLSPGALVSHIERNPLRPGWQTVSESLLFNTEAVPPFLPNPRYDPRLHALDLMTQLRIEQDRQRNEDLRTHFLPRARGLASALETDWRFEGRHAALRRLSSWLAEADQEQNGAVVVTGAPGSGKSAVLGRLVVLADERWRGSVPFDRSPEDTRPPPGSIDAAIHARRLTTGQVLQALCAAAGVVADSAGTLLPQIKNQRFTVAIDALDEAIDPRGLAEELIRPLIEFSSPTGFRIILGSRRHIADDLGGKFLRLDLDSAEYADRASVRRYCRRCLVEASPESPFRLAEARLLDEVTDAVSASAGDSFLVAQIVATSLALRAALPDPHDPAWRDTLPSTAADAMRTDLETRLGPQAQTAIDLLIPLAFAQGGGLPWEDVWTDLAGRLSGNQFTDEDIVWLQEQAGCYIIEAVVQGRSVYRLYHTAMAEYVARNAVPERIHEGIVDFFTERARPSPNPDWSRVHPYARRHLATHAASCARLDALLVDPGYLIAAEPEELLDALAISETPDGRAAGAAYKRSLHRLSDGATAPSHLQLGALQVGARRLAQDIASRYTDRPWAVSWARWKTETPHRLLASFPEPVSRLCVGRYRSDDPVLAVVHGRYLEFLDPTTGRRLGRWGGRAPISEARLRRGADGALTVVAVDLRRRLTVIDVATQQVLVRIRLPLSGRLPSRISALHDLVSHPVSPRFPDAYIHCEPRSGDDPVAITFTGYRADAWDLDSGRRLRTEVLKDPVPRLTSLLRVVDRASDVSELEDAMAVPRSAEEETVATGDGGTLTVVPELSDLHVTRRSDNDAVPLTLRVSGHQGPVLDLEQLQVGEDQRNVLTCASDGTVRSWDVADWRFTREVPPQASEQAATWTGLGPEAATARLIAIDGDGLPHQIDVASGRHSAFDVPEPKGNVVDVASAELRSEEGGSIRLALGFVAAERGEWRAWDTATGRLLGSAYASETLAYSVALCGMPTGEAIAATVGHGRHAALWDVTVRSGDPGGTSQSVEIRPRRRLAGGHSGWTSCVAVGTAPSGAQVVVTGGHDGRICLWRLPSGRRMYRFLASPSRWWILPSRRTHVRDVAYAIGPDRTPVVISLSEVGAIDVWRPRRGRLVKHIAPDSLPVSLMAVHSSDIGPLFLAGASHNGTIRIWRASAGEARARKRWSFELIHTLETEVTPTGMAFSGERKLIVSTLTGMIALEFRPVPPSHGV